jgi:ABC-type uncharacterized transport system ATPase subunit
MKKSECFKMAQEAVIKNQSISTEDKLEILRVLMEKEDLALFTEKEDENKKLTCEVTSNG